MESYNLKMDFHKISVPYLFLCLLLNCRPISVRGDSWNVRKLQPPRVRRYLANETVSSNGDNTSVNTLATNTNGIDKETIEQNIHSTPLQTTEGRSSSSVQKSEINSQSINISDIKQVTENAVSSNNISGFEKVASSPMTIDSTPKTNTLDKDVTKQSKDIKFTESLPMESTDIEHFINTKTTAIPASSPTFNGKSTEKPTDIIDIKPIDKLPNEKKVSNITDSTSATVNTDSTKPKQTPPTKIRPTVLNKTTPTTSVHHSDVGAISSSQPVFNERAANDKAFVWKRTALSNGKDTLANMDDENVKSTTAHLLDLLVNNTSDFIFTFMTANPALLNNASSSKPGPKVKTTIIDNNVDTDVSSTSDTYRKTTLSETNENTEHTSQSVTSDSKSETPVPKPGVTTLNISLPKTGATTPKTDKVSTEKNDRTTVLKPFTPTTDKAKETIDTAENLVKPGSNESMFGKYGLAMFIAACAVILCLLLVIIYLALNRKRKRKEEDFMVGNSVPKLRMLEIKNSTVPDELKPGKVGNKGDIPTYSLDYEKHVQEKIEEHRKLVKTKSQNPTIPGAEPTPLAGVTSFKIERRPSGASGAKRSSQKSRTGSQSGPTSPATPPYPEGKPLLDKGDEPVVFNFAKKPGEATAAREARAARRGSAPNAGNKMKSVTKSKDDYFGVNV